MSKIEILEERVKDLKGRLENPCLNADEAVDLGADLYEAQEQLRFAYEDEALDQQGLPHPWGY